MGVSLHKMSQQLHTPFVGQAQPDLVVAGAGVMGLWAARHALKRGESVLVLEKREVGAGASGGFLGSLMPHMPDRWNAKKQLQYDGLASLEAAVGELEADTGLDCGYRRCGRLMPMKHERMLAHLEERIAGARDWWTDEDGKQAYFMEHVPPEELGRRFKTPDGTPWLSPDLAEFGASHDTLSARAHPRSYLMALAAYVRNHPRGEIREGAHVLAIETDGDGVSASLADGSRIGCGRAVIANGWEAYALLGAMNGGKGAVCAGQPITGRGVKGQAVLFELAHDDSLPIIYDSGTYIIPHGTVAGSDEEGGPHLISAGSTSVDDWLGWHEDAEQARKAFDRDDTAFYDHAYELAPALEHAPIVRRWANVRPRNTMTDPETGKVGTDALFGALEGQENIRVAIGGFKISFALAHLAHEL